jgi:hypothetical protein
MKFAIGVLLSAMSVMSIDAFAASSVSGAFGAKDGGQDQHREELAVTVVDSAGPITGAKCVLSNDKGSWTVTAPDTVHVVRSKSNLAVECSKDGYAPTSGTLSASTVQVAPKHFQFSSDAGGDGEDDSPITVPQYAPEITVTLGSKPAA